ncbi:GATA transcription factor 18-like [Vigna umbellata]|uniref:GATA transcription factor 18-like n=1 Tax=Vigna umbellata TaxID=87088 RepID=UPI001F5F3DE3|nr:GATA transcription factor 18-like [Vigna umbellata]
MGPCTCGISHGQTTSFSMPFSGPNHKPPYQDSDIYDYSFTSSSSSSSSSVDCTLSLGTPSTRFSQDDQKPTRHERRSVSNFCWDLLQSKHNPQSQTKSSRTSNTTSNPDPLIARRCANCDTTSTPLWRNGPRGPKSLCNACGIRFKKEERRASAAAAPPQRASGGMMESAQVYNNSWYAHPQSQKMQCFSPGMGSEFRFADDGDRDADNGIPFLSWRLNVADRTSLVHDFTR